MFESTFGCFFRGGNIMMEPIPNNPINLVRKTRANELIKFMEQWSISADEAREILYAAQDELRERSYKTLLGDLKK